MLLAMLLRNEECSSCDEVLQELQAMQEEFPDLRIRERLLDDEPELTGRLGVVAAPALVVNGELAFQGHPERDQLRTYLRNVQRGLHDDPDAYPPDDERVAANTGQEATGSMDTEWRGSGRRPGFGSNPGGRH